jgi:flagellin
MSSINTNLGAAIGLQNLSRTQTNLDTTTRHISTGKRVSTPQEEAAIFAIAQGLQSDLQGFDAVQQSLSSATGATAVATAGATAVSDLLTNLKAQAIEASKPSNTAGQQTILSAGFNATLNQIGTIVQNATYNGVNLLSSGSQSVSVTSTITGGQLTIQNASGVGGVTAALAGGVATTAAALSLLTAIDTQQLVVGSALGNLGATQNSINQQSDFQVVLSNATAQGLGSLVDANLPAEAAKLQALNVQQQLGSQTLSIANQRPQALLGLFR